MGRPNPQNHDLAQPKFVQAFKERGPGDAQASGHHAVGHPFFLHLREDPRVDQFSWTVADLPLLLRELPSGLCALQKKGALVFSDGRKEVEEEFSLRGAGVDGVLHEDQGLLSPLKLVGDVGQVFHGAADAVKTIGDEPIGLAVEDFLLDPLEHGAAFHGGADLLLDPEELVPMEGAVLLDGVFLDLKAVALGLGD